MRGGVIKCAVVPWVLVLSAAAALADSGTLELDDLPPPKPEVATSAPNVDLPRIPRLALPAVEPGFHGPRELRVRGNRLLGTEIKVKGYVTWVYDCVAALSEANPRTMRSQVLEAIQRDPLICPQPQFYLADTPTTSPDGSLWVVDVPRPRAQLSIGATATGSMIERNTDPTAPKLVVGDFVVVTGTWATESQHGDRKPAGLLIYRALVPNQAIARRENCRAVT